MTIALIVCATIVLVVLIITCAVFRSDQLEREHILKKLVAEKNAEQALSMDKVRSAEIDLEHSKLNAR